MLKELVNIITLLIALSILSLISAPVLQTLSLTIRSIPTTL
jgi:type II secretory pathway component PulJ